MTDFLFVEKYRPRKIADCILPPRIKKDLQAIVTKGEIPNLLFEGSPGTGKTTAAKALCEEIGVDYLLINSSEERGIDILRNKVTDFASTMSIYGGKKCIILDEADFLTPEAQAAFRGIVERVSTNCTFILTCNYASKLMDAIDSRTSTISFKFNKDEELSLKTKMLKRLRSILENENVEYEDLALVRLVDRYYPDFRKTIGELQRLANSGKVTSETEITPTQSVEQLFKFMKGKEFNKVRKWVAENDDMLSGKLYRIIYDGLYEYLKPSCIPLVVILIAKYQYQHSMVLDPEINMVAFLTELMIEAEFQ